VVIFHEYREVILSLNSRWICRRDEYTESAAATGANGQYQEGINSGLLSGIR
jgi:hypothetical protein